MKHQIVAVIGAISLSLVLFIGIQQGVISMSDVSAWLTPAILGGIIAILVWGFKDQIEAALQNGSSKTNTETEKLAVYSPIHAMIVRLNSEVPREKALQAQNTVGIRVSASLIDFSSISAVFNQHNDKFTAKDLKMWIDIEEEIKIDNHFYLSNDRQKWFDELETEYKRLKEHNKTYREDSGG